MEPRPLIRGSFTEDFMRRLILGVTAMLAGSLPAFAAPANPAGLFFNNTFKFVANFQHPTGMLITGQCNRTSTHFSDARAAGAEVLMYINPVERIDSGDPCTAY